MLGKKLYKKKQEIKNKNQISHDSWIVLMFSKVTKRLVLLIRKKFQETQKCTDWKTIF